MLSVLYGFRQMRSFWCLDCFFWEACKLQVNLEETWHQLTVEALVSPACYELSRLKSSRPKTWLVSLSFISSLTLNYHSYKIIDSIIYPFLWSCIEPSAAIWGACITTYRPLFANLNLGFMSSLKHFKISKNSSNSWCERKDCNSNSIGCSSTQVMPWPIERPVTGDLPICYKNLSSKATKNNLHTVTVTSVPPDSIDLSEDKDHHPRSPTKLNGCPV